MSPACAMLKGVSKTFGQGRTRVQALRDVTLSIHAGELTLIEGPSGSGKTTLLQIVGLLQRADEGEVWLRGQRVDALPESVLPDRRREEVALIFQVHNLLESLTARDNVALANLLTRDTAVSADALLEKLNLGGRVRHLPAELSGGERQRTAIARALACPGRLVLADEPTANLDWENAREVIRSLSQMAREDGKAVVVVSHDSRLEPFADRIIRLENGEIREDHRLDDPPMLDESRTPPPPAANAAARPGRVPIVVVMIIGALLLAGGIIAGRYLPAVELASTPALPVVTTAPPRPFVTAAPAVVEPSTQLVAIRAERQGRIKEILKRAGDRIEAGEVLVRLDDVTSQALVDQRRADLILAEANLAELKAWDRSEERAKARAAVERAQARLDRAERELKRVQSLVSRTAASDTELQDAIEEQRLAAASLDEARQVMLISEAGPTPEQVSVAEAKVEQARAALRMAEAELELRTIRSPLDGHVIYRHLEPGEVVDPESAVPILSVGRLDDVCLRAEVDEADIDRVRVGQRIIATAEALGDRELTGRVVHLEPMMGRRSIRTQRTTEQQDTKVREVLIALDPDTPPLPIDLQMTVRFLAATEPSDTTPRTTTREAAAE